jgi:hypothetical protein
LITHIGDSAGVSEARGRDTVRSERDGEEEKEKQRKEEKKKKRNRRATGVRRERKNVHWNMELDHRIVSWKHDCSRNIRQPKSDSTIGTKTPGVTK